MSEKKKTHSSFSQVSGGRDLKNQPSYWMSLGEGGEVTGGKRLIRIFRSGVVWGVGKIYNTTYGKVETIEIR